MLHFGMKMPFSFEEFLGMCTNVVSENDIEIIKACKEISGSSVEESQETLQKWHTFDTALRNALVRIRAARKHKDPDKYLRQNGYQDSHITNLAMNAYKHPSILESEKILDKERWQALEDLASCHQFDIDALIVYTHKLLILEKHNRINTADKTRELEKVI